MLLRITFKNCRYVVENHIQELQSAAENQFHCSARTPPKRPSGPPARLFCLPCLGTRGYWKRLPLWRVISWSAIRPDDRQNNVLMNVQGELIGEGLPDGRVVCSDA